MALCRRCGHIHYTTLEELNCASGKRTKVGGTQGKGRVEVLRPGASVSEISGARVGAGPEEGETGVVDTSDPLAAFKMADNHREGGLVKKTLDDYPKLPSWRDPKNLTEARTKILHLGQSMHEHAYLLGKYLLWIKDKVGHGNFLAWIEDNVWFTDRTARGMMRFAEHCDQAATLLPYHGIKTELNSDLSSPPLPSGKYPRRDEKAADVLFAQAQTRRLKALGVLLGNGNGESFIDKCADKGLLHPHPRRGRKRLYKSDAKRQRAYRERKSVVLRNRFVTTGF